jgi:methyl-accepting chemotaxis protein
LKIDKGLRILSIRTRLFVITLSLMVVSLSVLGGVSYYFTKQVLGESINETAMSIGSDYTKLVKLSVNEF